MRGVCRICNFDTVFKRLPVIWKVESMRHATSTGFLPRRTCCGRVLRSARIPGLDIWRFLLSLLPGDSTAG